MGMRGYFAYRYKGYYYIKYNHWDSLGLDLVRTIPKTKEKFELEEWLEKYKKFCEDLDSKSDSDDPEYQKSRNPPETDLFIEWTYTFDLDNLCFVVDSSAFFDLEAIAKIDEEEWIQFLALDPRGNRCLRLNTPPELIGKFKFSENLVLGETPVPSADILTPMVIKSPTTWSQPLSPHHRRLMLILANSVIAESYSLLSTVHQYEPDHKKFRTTATTFLASIIPNNQVLLTDHHSASYERSQSLGGGPWFWYRGCLILLANQLDNKERFDCYIRAVVSRAKAKNLDTCVAILWSIQHVAVIEISSGLVSHSHAIPFLAAYGSDEESFLSALHLLWHYLPYPRRRIVDERDRRSSALHSRTLPAEIKLKIMACTEASDYSKYQFISRDFFEMWWSHLRLSKFTIISDANQFGDTSHFFTAQAPDDTMPVLLNMQFKWGVGESNIWGGPELENVEDPDRFEAWGEYGKTLDRKRNNSSDASSFIIYVHQFSNAWIDDIYKFPTVRDKFSSHTHDLICEVLEK